jgi:tRNA-splicing ligase RtcB (3'-phosphate/5'-hydroxy nucleic acid ligase)
MNDNKKVRMIDDLIVFGTDADDGAVKQMQKLSEHPNFAHGALMADHHLGYSQPIGGVVAYRNAISVSGVGFDISCGNAAVCTGVRYDDIKDSVGDIMDEIFSTISFGVGRKNSEDLSGHAVFTHKNWDIVSNWNSNLKDLAIEQLGTVGSGNHYVDLFCDSETGLIWVGVHFGSRGLGHKIATHYMNVAGVNPNTDEAAILTSDSPYYDEYIACMNLAGEYAYAGRDWVCDTIVNKILKGKIRDRVHNHHNFSWEEDHYGEKLNVVRKGATPAFPGQRGFIGSSMGEPSYIVSGGYTDYNTDAAGIQRLSMFSTVHGAGRVMSRTQAAGKKRWKRETPDGPKKLVVVKEGCISHQDMYDWVEKSGVVLRGGGTDESPHCYKRLDEVLDCHGDTIKIEKILIPVGVCMAGEGEYDPYKD